MSSSLFKTLSSLLSPTIGINHNSTEAPSFHPKARLIWDDIVFIGKPFNAPKSFRLKWPDNDEYLLKQFYPEGRCPNYSTRSDASQDQRDLETLIYTPDLFRLTGFPNSRLFTSKTRLKPTHTASAISVICNYRDHSDITLRLIQSLAHQVTGAPIEVVLVNNQSTQEELQRVRDGAESILTSAGLKVVHIDYDFPFNHSAQCNMAAKIASGDTLVMVNNDAKFLDKHALQEMADWAHTPGIATAGPRVVGDWGRLISAGIEIIVRPHTGILRIRESQYLPLSRVVRHTVGNSFCCCAIKKTIWEKLEGLRADVFPTQYNDADFVIRCLNVELRHLYIGHLAIYHEPGKSESRTVERVEALHARLVQLHPNMGVYESEAPILLSLKKRPPGTHGFKKAVWISKRLVVMVKTSARWLLIAGFRRIVEPILQFAHRS